MKLRIYRTLWGVLEETDGEKVCHHFVIIIFSSAFVIILSYNHFHLRLSSFCHIIIFIGICHYYVIIFSYNYFHRHHQNIFFNHFAI